MESSTTSASLAVHGLVKEWMNAHQPAVAWSVFEDQKTMDICIRILLLGDPKEKILKPYRANNLLDSGIEVEIEGWLANLPYPKLAFAEQSD
jgi:hypothetical protein